MSKHKNQNREILVHLPHTALDRHPRNMRRSYAPEDVRRMAINQADRAKRGLDPCVHPLIVTPGPSQQYNPRRHKRLIIVAGHLRHAGNSWLGKDAPLLNCIVRYYADEQAMQADMSTENGVRADISPLDWAHVDANFAVQCGRWYFAVAQFSLTSTVGVATGGRVVNG
jgi:hypothetical protein